VLLYPVYIKDDKFILIYLRLINNENYNLRKFVRIEDYEFNIIILKPNENKNFELFEKLKEKFNFF